MQNQQIILIHGKNHKQMTKQLLQAAGLADEIGSRDTPVALKPNLVIGAPASRGATTHPELVAGVLEYLQENGFRDLRVIEGSWVGSRTSEAVQTSGLLDVCRQYRVPFIDLQKDASASYDAKGMQIKVCNEAMRPGFLINMPVLKGHGQTLITCALKNAKGLIPNSEKRRFHALGLHAPIAHLNALIHWDFILVDNICGDLDFEEGGNPVEMDRIFACKDPVLCDSFVCRTMGYQPQDVSYIPMAEALGVGSTDLSAATITALNEPAQAVTDQRPSRRVQALGRYVCADAACSACYGSLLYALNKLEADYGRLTFDDTICIGQNYRGKTGSLGIGSCTQGFACSLKGCPPSAAEIYDFLLAHMTAR